MNHLTEMFKGVLEGCILEIIGKNEAYGYEIILKLRDIGFSTTSSSTVYTILKRFEKSGLIKSEVLSTKKGPDRKVYSLTDEGRSRLGYFWKKWEFLSARLEELRNEKPDNF